MHKRGDRAKKFYTEVFDYELIDLPMSNDRHSDMRHASFPGDEKSVSGALVKIEQAASKPPVAK